MICSVCNKDVDKTYDGLCRRCFAQRAKEYGEEDMGIDLTGEYIESKSNLESITKIFKYAMNVKGNKKEVRDTGIEKVGG